MGMPSAVNEETALTAAPALKALCAKAVQSMPGYAGDVTPREAWDYLSQYPAMVVDVRTHAEWLFIGAPDLHNTPGKLIQVSWKLYPTFAINLQFLEQLAQHAVAKNIPLFFICRSGGRSLDAAIAATQAGYKTCFNIQGGFEGEPDALGQRGTQEGWKAANLPWRQG